MNKTQWLDWVEAGAERLQQRYREARNRASGRAGEPEPVEPRKCWSLVRAEVDREDRDIVIHIDLPEPHTDLASVRVINSTLSIAVLKTGSDIRRAPAEDFYRRAIPLPPKVDPRSATHRIHGDELVIRMHTAAPRRQAAADARATANGQEKTNGEATVNGEVETHIAAKARGDANPPREARTNGGQQTGGKTLKRRKTPTGQAAPAPRQVAAAAVRERARQHSAAIPGRGKRGRTARSG